ncbi:hypothetical protein DXG01_006463 [Tephrocybe rancida]|nr:hypothetical protein DXG01_006463 [Tephrocybe rancida]
MEFLSSSKKLSVFNSGFLPVALTVIKLTFEFGKGLLPISTPPQLVVGKARIPPLSLGTPTTALPPTPTLSINQGASDTTIPVLVGLVFVVLGIMVGAGSTYIRTKSGNIFTPNTLPHQQGQDPPRQPPPSPIQEEDECSADDEDEGDGEDGEGDGDGSEGDGSETEEEDEEEQNEDGDGNPGGEPDEPTDGADVDDLPPPPFVPRSWVVFLLSLLYFASITGLVKTCFSTRFKRITSAIQQRLSTLSAQYNASGIIVCVLEWLDDDMLRLLDELFWIDNEPHEVALSVGKRSLGFGSTPVTLYSMEELQGFKHTVINKLRTIPPTISGWVSWLCSSCRNNATRTLGASTTARRKTLASRIGSILCASAGYGAIAILIRTLLNIRTRNGRVREQPQLQFDEEESTAVDEESDSEHSVTLDVLRMYEDGEDEGGNITAHSDILQGPGLNTTDHYISYPSVLVSEMSESASAYITAPSISDISAGTTSPPVGKFGASLPDEDSDFPEQYENEAICEGEDEGYGHYVQEEGLYEEEDQYGDEYPGVYELDEDPSTGSGYEQEGYGDQEDLPVDDIGTSVPDLSEQYGNEATSDSENEGYGHYVQEEGWYEEEDRYGDEYPGLYDDEEDGEAGGGYGQEDDSDDIQQRQCEEDMCEERGDQYDDDVAMDAEDEEEEEVQGGYVAEDWYEEEDAYGDEYPGYYEDEDFVEYSREDQEPEEATEEECMDMGSEEIDHGDDDPPQPPYASHNYIPALDVTEIAYRAEMRRQVVEEVERQQAASAKAWLARVTRKPQLGVMPEVDIRQKAIEGRVGASDAGYVPFPDAEPIEGSNITVYFTRRPSSRFCYTDADSLEARQSVPRRSLDITRDTVRKVRSMVEAAYSPKRYDAKQIDGLTLWHLELRGEEDGSY